MKSNKDITVLSDIYEVSADIIKVKKAHKVEVIKENEICVRVYQCNHDFKGKIDECTLVCDPYPSFVLYSRLKDAQQKQAELREKCISDAKEALDKANKNYHDVVLKYLNQPLDNPYKEKTDVEN